MAVGDSILSSIKHNLGIEADYTPFDLDITMYINGAFATLNQLGIGPEEGFSIADATATWVSFIGTNPKLDNVKNYVYLKTRLLFDPPPNSFTISMMQEQIKEMEWRINTYREEYAWVNPDLDLPVDEDLVLDGGAP